MSENQLEFSYHNLSKVVFMTNQLGKIGKMHYDLTNSVQKQLLFFFKTTYGRSQWWFEYNDLAVATDFQAQVDFVEATTITTTKNASKIGKVAANKKVKADSKRRTRCSFTSCFGGGYTWLLNWGKARTTMRIAAASTTTTTATILVDLAKVQTLRIGPMEWRKIRPDWLK